MKRFELGYVCVELSEDTVARLLTDGQLCAADLRCMDCRSKECVLKIVLNTCRPPRSMGLDIAEN